VSDSIYEEIGNQEYRSFVLGILVGMDIMEQKQSILEG
jgi:2-keto-3-deoxy-galactonokinase